MANEDTMTIENITTITVVRAVGRHDLGEVGPRGLAVWGEACRAEIEAEIKSELARCYPKAEADVTVVIGEKAALEVEAFDEEGDYVCADIQRHVLRTVQDASNAGFERACGNG